MKLSGLVSALNLRVVTGELSKDPEISTVYSCDLLSRVMSKGSKDGVWITVLAHVNIIAVAQLVDLACIIIPEDIPVIQDTINKAGEEGINVLSTPMTGYEVSWKIHDLIK